jgi:uncharacterized protein (TIGR01244 family)
MRLANVVTRVALAALLGPQVAAAQEFTRPGPIEKLTAPAILDTTGLFLARFARVGDVFVAGQPTPRALRELRAQGVTTVVNLRMPDEMRRVGFDEAALVAELGMKYVYLPVRDGTDKPYSPTTVDGFAEAIRTANGKVLLHCTVAWRASHLWAAYLIRDRGVPIQDALANARAINLMDDHRMSSSGRQPVEEFLGRTLTSLGRQAP